MDEKKPGGSGCEVVHTGLFVEEVSCCGKLMIPYGRKKTRGFRV
jgi:hypothetical protein